MFRIVITFAPYFSLGFVQDRHDRFACTPVLCTECTEFETVVSLVEARTDSYCRECEYCWLILGTFNSGRPGIIRIVSELPEMSAWKLWDWEKFPQCKQNVELFLFWGVCQGVEQEMYMSSIGGTHWLFYVTKSSSSVYGERPLGFRWLFLPARHSWLLLLLAPVAIYFHHFVWNRVAHLCRLNLEQCQVPRVSVAHPILSWRECPHPPSPPPQPHPHPRAHLVSWTNFVACRFCGRTALPRKAITASAHVKKQGHMALLWRLTTYKLADLPDY